MIRLRVLAVAVLAVACFGFADSALASDASVRRAIETSSREVTESGELKNALTKLQEDPQTVEKDHKAIGKLDVAIGKVIAKVSAQHASTAAGKKGEQDYVSGLRKLITGFSDLDKALTDVKSHEKSAAETELSKGRAVIRAGAAEGKKAKLLLHVKS